MYTENQMTELAALLRHLGVTPDRLPTDQLVELLELEDLATSSILEASDLQRGTVKDAWGNRILLQSADSSVTRIAFVSYGPNGRNDDWGGDDIVVGVAIGDDKMEDGAIHQDAK